MQMLEPDEARLFINESFQTRPLIREVDNWMTLALLYYFLNDTTNTI